VDVNFSVDFSSAPRPMPPSGTLLGDAFGRSQESSPRNAVSCMMSALEPPKLQKMSQMHRQSLVAYGQPLCETVADYPSPRGGEVLVRIERCGVCHSDLHLQDGRSSGTRPAPNAARFYLSVWEGSA
jgi:hypothetical protein